MAIQSHRITVREARRVTHPVYPHIEKHYLTVAALAFPKGISTKINARDPVGINRPVYRDVRASLEGKTVEGLFDLMNKGITILAQSVKLIDKEKGVYELLIDDEIGGIVDGAHTAKIIEESNADGTTPAEQYVEVYVRTGIDKSSITDIARGLNTGIQVKNQSIYNIDKVFDWMKDEIKGTLYANNIAWNESDDKEYDVRDLIGVIEVFNVIDYPNNSGKHPISAYEKWSLPLKSFAEDFEEHRDDLSKSKYHRLRGLLKEALALYDHVRYDFYRIRNASGGAAAGKMKIMEVASSRKKAFDFPFANLPPFEYRLTKGAAYPMLAALRNFVEIDADSGNAVWRGGFGTVLRAWTELAPMLVEATIQFTKENGHLPDQVGKSRSHWEKLHMLTRLELAEGRFNPGKTSAPVRKRK